MMIGYKKKHSIWFKTITIGVVCLLSVNNISWAKPSSFTASRTTLAPYTQLPNRETKEKFKAMAFRLAEEGVDAYLRTQIEKEIGILGYERWREDRVKRIDITLPENKGNIKYDLDWLQYVNAIKLTGVLDNTHEGLLARIDPEGILVNTGQFGGVGLRGKHYEGIPVFYIDSGFFHHEHGKIIIKHETDEIKQWEYFRVKILGIPRGEIRQWIINHIDSPDKRLDGYKEYKGKNSRQIAKMFHDRSYPLDSLYELYGERIDFNYEYINFMLSLYGMDEKSQNVNIAAYEEKKQGGPPESEGGIDLSKLISLLSIQVAQGKDYVYFQSLFENPDRLAQTVSDFKGKPERLDTLVHLQASYRNQAAVELIANAVDAVMPEEIIRIGRFGIGAFQCLAE
ncbi:MAG: hypothetical protein KAU58_06715, partial [Candidatus Omnitrophica bacterium]|nr:hypothetical protein [Candidatus Omnitrophota bacterium]